MTLSAELHATSPDRPMPQAIEAERAILASVLIDNRAYYRVQGLRPEDFFRDVHRTLWTHVQAIMASGAAVDLLTLKASLGLQLGRVGGSSYITGLLDPIPDMTNVEQYAELVTRAASLRRIITAANEAMQAAMSGEDEPEVIASGMIASLTSTATADDSRARPMAEAVRDAYAEAQRRHDDNRTLAFTTGLAELDAYQVIRPTFIAVASPSNHGKTAFAVNLAEGLATHGHPTLFCTLESTAEEIVWRDASAQSGVSHSRVRDWRRLEADDFRALAEFERHCAKLPIYLSRGLRSVDAIYAECRRLKSTVGLDAVVVDYVQLLRIANGPRDREERMALIASRLLEMAIDMNVAVIATSQVNKDRVTRESGRLQLNDLKYAAAIGEAARVVLAFQRPYADDPKSEHPPCYVAFQIAKNNEGRTGDYAMHFNERTQKFADGDCAANRCHRAQIDPNEPEKELF